MKPVSYLLILVVILLSVVSVAGAQVVQVVNNEEGFQTMQYGDSGEEVSQLQEQLASLGYFSGEVTGSYLEDTQSAVRKFQLDYGLEETGEVDGETEAAIFNTEYRDLTTGDSGDDVARIQEYLITFDYYNGAVSGKYLEGTTFGIKLFQEKNGLDVTGSADIETQRLLFSGTALSRYAMDTSAANYEFKQKLIRGSQGNQVKLVQNRLTELGFFSGPISGNYMNQTIEAVKAFQEKNGLYVDGITGKDTWAALFGLDEALDASASPTPIPYAITVDIVNQAVIVYGLDANGEHTVPLRYMVCSTGTEKNPTPLGEFEMTGRKARWAFFSLYGSYAQYWTLITEDIAFHSVIYDEVDLYALSRRSYNRLGRRASHGCIRLLVHDAQWIYENAGAGTIVTVTDTIAEDPELQAALDPGDLDSSYTASPLYAGSAMPPQPFRKLQKSAAGEDVYWLQMKLKELGYYHGAIATGTYLTGTIAAVKAFQKDHDLSVDGIAGLDTLSLIYEDVLNPQTPAPAVSPTPAPSPSSTPSPSVSPSPAP